jgi:hypothetical protein
MDNTFKRRLAIALICILALMVGCIAQVHASEKTDGKNMKKVLKYYKQGKYSKARKYSKKLPSRAKEEAVQNMSVDMKKAYKKKVKSYVKKYGLDIGNGKKYVWDYFLTDIDNDKNADLIVEYGSCEADVRYAVYQYKDGKAKKVGKTYCSHTAFHAYPNHKGIVLHWTQMGNESLSVATIKDGKLTSKLYGGRTISAKKKPLKLGCALKHHVTFDKNYKPHISYKDLV